MDEYAEAVLKQSRKYDEYCHREIPGVFRFHVGDKVWVRDRAHGKPGNLNGRGGYTIVEATVRELHYHLGRHPFYPNGEGYALDGDLWWDCYPGCRVAATRKEATAIRLSNFGN